MKKRVRPLKTIGGNIIPQLIYEYSNTLLFHHHNYSGLKHEILMIRSL
jgi:hypothetical protein